MKLIKCYINNFGKLSDFSLDFNQDITVINEDNGFGKTTLCAFIKAMFYGFNQTRSKDLEENERLKYLPWQGGVFGGSLDFSCEKGSYRIERTFGQKASEDTFSLINLNLGKISADFSQNIGEELFGIDLKGYERCVLVEGINQKSKMPLSISTKLSSAIDDTDDLNNYDTAMAALLKRSRKYSTTGNRGIIFDIKREIIDTQGRIDDSLQAAEDIKSFVAEKEALENKKIAIEKELENTRALISENASKEVLKEKIKHYNSLVSAVKSSKEKLEKYKDKYLGNVPAESDLNELSEIVKRIESLSAPAEVEYLKKKRVIHSTIHSVIWILAAILFVFGEGWLFLTAGGVIIAADIICAIALNLSQKSKTKKTENELQNAVESVDKILKEFGRVKENKSYSDVLSEIKSDIYEYAIEKSKFEEYSDNAAQYYKEENLESVKKDLNEKSSEELRFKERELTRTLDSVSSEIIRLSAEIEKTQKIVDSISGFVYKKEVLEKKLAIATENYNALSKGMALLSKAKENLTDKYKNKIEESFKNNLRFLSDGRINDTLLSNDFDVSIVDSGFGRDVDSYSSGLKAIIEIALRLSLAETLFENEKCFMIFDDPFAYLDDKILTKMAEKVRKLSQKNQIIYVTCTKSRIF